MSTTNSGVEPVAEVPSGSGELRRHWKALTAATMGIAVGIAIIPIYTAGLVLPSLRTEFGWSRAQLSSLQLVGSLILILTAPVVGWIVDRIGVRLPGVVSLIALGLGYFALSISGPSFVSYLIVWIVMYVLASASTPLPFTRTVNERFDRARGLALGVSVSGAGLVAILIPVLLGPLMADSWRTGYRAIGAVVLVCAVVVAVLLPNSRRSQTSAGRDSAAVRTSIVPFLRTGLFMRLALVFLLLSLAVGWILLFLVSLLREGGTAPATAARIAGLVGVSLIVGRLGIGLLVDRFFAPRVAAVVEIVAAAGFLALLFGGTAFGAVGAVAVGLAIGAETDLLGYLISRYYRIDTYGRMFGAFYAVFLLGFGVSPLAIGGLRETTGGFSVSVIIAVVMLVGAAALLLTLPRFPQHGDAIAADPKRNSSATKSRLAGPQQQPRAGIDHKAP